MPTRSLPLNIVVVEDDDDARASLCDILELGDHVVVSAASAEKAFLLQQLAEADVLILDRQLPDGLVEEILPRFRESAPSADMIIVTGYADLDGTISAMRGGAADYIIKPINPESLLQRLDAIAERRLIQGELQEERRLSEKILNTAEAIVLVLDRNGKVVRFNPFLSELTGYSKSELTGVDWFDVFIPSRDRERIRNVFHDTMEKIDSRGTNPILTKSGDERHIRWSNTVLEDESGAISGVLAIGLDVTDFTSTQRKLLQAERLAAIGETMAGMAHESRNALQRIQNAVDLLEEDLADNPVALRDLLKIQRAGNDLRNLLDEVRSYASPIHLDISDSTICSAWQRAWADLAVRTKHRQVQLIHEPSDADEHLIAIDARRMQQVFRNLFENALDACNDPVTLRIHCKVVGAAMQIVLQDDGPGISNTAKEHIFHAFYTSKPTGTGLGLAIVFRIVEAHGGSIAVVDSEVGCKFRIVLPLSEAATP